MRRRIVVKENDAATNEREELPIGAAFILLGALAVTAAVADVAGLETEARRVARMRAANQVAANRECLHARPHLAKVGLDRLPLLLILYLQIIEPRDEAPVATDREHRYIALRH